MSEWVFVFDSQIWNVERLDPAVWTLSMIEQNCKEPGQLVYIQDIQDIYGIRLDNINHGQHTWVIVLNVKKSGKFFAPFNFSSEDQMKSRLILVDHTVGGHS